jgi:hypothetical protein
MSLDDTTVECSLCGRNGNPPVGCEICHGNAQVQERAYTLSEERSGRAPVEERYGTTGSTAPKASPLVVGAEVHHPGNRH